MKFFSTSTQSMFSVLCLLGLFLVGCDSNDNDELSEEEALEAISEMASSVFDVAGQVAFGVYSDGTTGTSAKKPTFNCPESGSIDYTVAADQSSYTMVFDDCNGINGELLFGLSFNITQQEVAVDFTLDGSVNEECTLTFAQFQQGAVVNLVDNSSVLSLNGSFSATCDRTAVYSCTYNNLTFTPDQDPSILEQGCGIEL